MSDESGKLREIIEKFNPLDDYSNELRNAIQFKTIFHKLPTMTIANGWIYDLLYIAVRNVLVFMSAVDKTYHFGYKVLLADYVNEFNLSDDDMLRLLEMRIAKQAYRNNPHFIDIPYQKLYQTINSCEKIIGPIKINFLPIIDFNKYVQDIIKNEKAPPYTKLRLLEGLYNCYGNRVAAIENVISQPQFYMYQAKKSQNLILWYNIINDARKNSPNNGYKQ